MSCYLSGTAPPELVYIFYILFYFIQYKAGVEAEVGDYSDVIYLVNVDASPHSVRADYQNIESHQRTSQSHKYFYCRKLRL